VRYPILVPMPIIELSHVIHAGMVRYPGLPGPEITRT
jgi:hypothetical protein